MSINDPLGDMLTRIRNAQMRRRPKVVTPASNIRGRVLDVLEEEGYIRGYSRVEQKGALPVFEIELKYFDGQPVIAEISRVSKPGRRVYSSIKDLKPIKNGLGITLSPDGRLISFVRDPPAAEETGSWIAALSYLPRAFKGYELCSWREGSDWHFTLIEGTNRVKSYEEIRSSQAAGSLPKITVTGVEAIMAALAQLPRGEQVFWLGEAWWEQTHQGARGHLAQPDQAIVDDIVRQCAQLGVELRRP